jgi:hypothetical protein
MPMTIIPYRSAAFFLHKTIGHPVIIVRNLVTCSLSSLTQKGKQTYRSVAEIETKNVPPIKVTGEGVQFTTFLAYILTFSFTKLDAPCRYHRVGNRK